MTFNTIITFMSKYQQKSKFHQYRANYQPKFPKILTEKFLEGMEKQAPVLADIAEEFPKLTEKGVKSINFSPGQPLEDELVHALRIGCVLSGGQAAGGHNVIIGIYDFIKRTHKSSQLFGFLNGPHGIFTGNYMEITDEDVEYFKNRGGFDMIRSGRDKIKTKEQFAKSLKYCESLKLDGLVVIGGDDSNTNAALLAEYFLAQGSNIKVIGCPKTIDGDLKNEFVEVSFGFDTACKTYSECIASVMADTLSSKKYYHFIRLMGRSASHITLECALLTRPTYAFIGEEIKEQKLSLNQIVSDLVKLIQTRSQASKQYGVILIPEGLIEFIPEINVLISEINALVAGLKDVDLKRLKEEIVGPKLTESSRKLFQFLPSDIANQLLLDRDPHGNVQVAKIETEKLLINLVENEIKSIKDFKGKFCPMNNYFGYEGRCAFPTNFDCDYCYSLGLNAGAIIRAKQTGLMSCIRNLEKEPAEWVPGGYPLVTMMNIELREEKKVPVIEKALVDLNGPLFKLYESKRKLWAEGEYFNLMGPIQFEFPQPKPFLAVPPQNEEDMLQVKEEEQHFEKDQQPYAVITSHNINPFTIALRDQEIQFPTALEGDVTIAYGQDQKSKDTLVQSATKKEYPFLLKEQKGMISFKKSQEPQQSSITRIGVCFNGRQCPGGHNAIAGLLDKGTEVLGFIGGTQGLFKGKYIHINEINIKNYVNQTGFHLLGRTADKLRTPQQLKKTKEVCEQLRLDGLILIGASHTLSDAAQLIEYLIKNGCSTVVNVIPAAIDNNIYHKSLQISIGFASSSQMYSTLISNLMIDASSNIKYWYFIRLMGRDPSHLTLECALSTRPNYTIISEEVQKKGWDVQELVDDIVRVVIKRQQRGYNFGCVVIPEGLPTFLPSLVRIKNELDEIKASNEEECVAQMSMWARQRYQKLPDFIQKQLFMRDKSTGSFALSQIETEKMLAVLVGQKIKQYHSFKGFSPVCHFFGYQGRCATPTYFDRKLSFTYGKIARVLVQNGLTGYCTAARGLNKNAKEWFPVGIPISQMLSIKDKSSYGLNKPIVESGSVKLNSPSFKYFMTNREIWELNDHYESPGPIQHFGQAKDSIPLTLQVNQGFSLEMVSSVNSQLAKIAGKVKFWSNERQLKAINSGLNNLLNILALMEEEE